MEKTDVGVVEFIGSSDRRPVFTFSAMGGGLILLLSKLRIRVELK